MFFVFSICTVAIWLVLTSISSNFLIISGLC